MKLQEFFDKGNMVQAMTNSQINFKRFVCFFLFIVQVTVNFTYKYFPIFMPHPTGNGHISNTSHDCITNKEVG